MKKMYLALFTMLSMQTMHSSETSKMNELIDDLSTMPQMAPRSNNMLQNIKERLEASYGKAKQKVKSTVSNIKHRFGTYRSNFQELKQRYKQNMQTLEQEKASQEDIQEEQTLYEQAKTMLHDAIKQLTNTEQTRATLMQKEKMAYQSEIKQLEKEYKQKLAQYEKAHTSTNEVGKTMSSFAQKRKKALLEYRKKIDGLHEEYEATPVPSTDELLPLIGPEAEKIATDPKPEPAEPQTKEA